MKCISQKATPIKSMVGYDANRSNIVKLPFVCVRKPVPKKKLKGLDYFCFVSNPNFVLQDYIHPFMWLHCHRDPQMLKCSSPKYLISESDFVDPIHSPVTRSTQIQYDYIYFTLAHEKGYHYKGMKTFLGILPILHSLRLRGLIVVYNTKNGICKEKKIMEKHGAHTVGGMNRIRAMNAISSCRFSLFPNVEDCSPRMIPETFLQNRPCMVNINIYGGWKYFENPKLGSVFNPKDSKSIISAVNHIRKLKFRQRKWWMSDYGFVRMSQKLASLLHKHRPYCKELEGITHAYFSEYSQLFTLYPEIFI